VRERLTFPVELYFKLLVWEDLSCFIIVVLLDDTFEKACFPFFTIILVFFFCAIRALRIFPSPYEIGHFNILLASVRIYSLNVWFHLEEVIWSHTWLVHDILSSFFDYLLGDSIHLLALKSSCELGSLSFFFSEGTFISVNLTYLGALEPVFKLSCLHLLLIQECFVFWSYAWVDHQKWVWLMGWFFSFRVLMLLKLLLEERSVKVSHA
jgi:hypothetical protein